VKRSGLHEYIDMMEKWYNRNYLVDYKGYRKKVWSYKKVRSAILSLSKVLLNKGIKKGDKIILCGKSCPEWVISFFAILHRGAVVVPIDPSSSKDFIYKICEKISPVLIICEVFPNDIRKEIILFSSIENISPCLICDACYITTNDLAEIVFTSGTTSQPKGVMLTHRNILSNLKPIDDGVEKWHKIVKFLTPFRMLYTLPYSHMFGQVTGIFLPILIGSTIYFTHDTCPASLLRAIRRDRILTLITVPRVIKLLADHIKAELGAQGKLKAFEKRWNRWVKLPYQIRFLFFLDIHRYLGLHFWSFITGGAPLDPETHEFWRRLVYSVFQGYGLTETAPMVTMFNPFKDNRSSVGRVFPGQKIRIATDGEILIKGENVMTGYYDDSKSTEETFEDGWLKTGDVGTVDEEGQVFIKGRKKDMILTSDGHNIFPEDIENVLNSIKGVRESIIIGMPFSSGEYAHAVLLLEPGVNPEDIIRDANNKLFPYQKIKGYTIWKEADFPRTSTQKIRKPEVIEVINKGKQDKYETKNILDDFITGPINPDLRLSSDLGMDSLDIVEAACSIEKKYNISVDESEVGPDTTVKELKELALKPSNIKEILMPRWINWKLIRVIRSIIINGIILPAMHIYCKIESKGIENLNISEGPLILTANHASNIDPLVILLALPHKLRKLITPAMGLNRFYAYFQDYISKGDLSKSRFVVRHILHGIAYYIITFLFQAFPFPQGTAYRASLEYTGELMDKGLWPLIFPEGELTHTGKLNPFKGGIALIAERTFAPVIPVGIKGMWDVMPYNKRFPKRGKVFISFGKPIMYSGEKYSDFAFKIEEAVRKLI